MNSSDPAALPACCTPTADASLAERLYCAYSAGGDPATAGLNFQGQPCPIWEKLPPNIQAKWQAASDVHITTEAVREVQVASFLTEMQAPLDAGTRLVDVDQMNRILATIRKSVVIANEDTPDLTAIGLVIRKTQRDSALATWDQMTETMNMVLRMAPVAPNGNAA